MIGQGPGQRFNFTLPTSLEMGSHLSDVLQPQRALVKYLSPSETLLRVVNVEIDPF